MHSLNKKKLLILGDFNAHYSMWGTTYYNRSDSVLAEWLTSLNYVLLNSTKPTHFSSTNPYS